MTIIDIYREHEAPDTDTEALARWIDDEAQGRTEPQRSMLQDFANMFRCRTPEEIAREAYVAASRRA